MGQGLGLAALRHAERFVVPRISIWYKSTSPAGGTTCSHGSELRRQRDSVPSPLSHSAEVASSLTQRRDQVGPCMAIWRNVQFLIESISQITLGATDGEG